MYTWCSTFFVLNSNYEWKDVNEKQIKPNNRSENEIFGDMFNIDLNTSMNALNSDRKLKWNSDGVKIEPSQLCLFLGKIQKSILCFICCKICRTQKSVVLLYSFHVFECFFFFFCLLS